MIGHRTTADRTFAYRSRAVTAADSLYANIIGGLFVFSLIIGLGVVFA